MAIQAGSRALASDVIPATKKLIARGNRLTNSTGTTTEVGVLRLDDIPIIGGRIYQISTSTLLLATNTANDFVNAKIRYTTDGSTPTTSSSLLTQTGGRIEATSSGDFAYLSGLYAPASDETLSVLLTVARGSGAGTVAINYGSSVPIELYIVDLGVDPGDTGTDI